MVCVQYRNTTLPLGFADTTATALPFVTDRDMHPALLLAFVFYGRTKY